MTPTNHNPTQPTGSRYLFREAARTLWQAAYCLLFIELPDWWDEHKEPIKQTAKDAIAVLLLLAALGVFYGAYWICYFLTHP